MSESSATLEAFRAFEAFSALTEDDLMVLADRASVKPVAKREVLFSEGDSDPWIYCLIAGSLELRASDGRVHRIDAGTRAAEQPVARLTPRKYTARAATPARVLRIDGSGLGDWQSYVFSHAPAATGGGGICVEEMADEGIGAPGDLPTFTPGSGIELDEVQFELPSLPTVAMEACRIVDADDTSVDLLAKVVVNDPPIAAKLIKAANSPVFYGREAIGTCERAIVRLGLKTTRQLVVSFAMRDLFKSEVPALESAMEALWRHSVEVAATAFVLARAVKGFDPAEAQLAGLLHDIGKVSVLGAAGSGKADAVDLDSLHALAERSRAEVGASLLEAWNFPSALIEAARDAEQWWRDDAPEPELADLVLVAQLMTFMGKREFLDLPPLVRLPAYGKLFGQQGSPEMILALLDEASEQIEQIKSLLSA